ncbi:hypothetical protein H7J06_15585 [Mycobacterium hodleri]|uniref:hypothetical protein n=1 Tax=Mycolicibacterium hodleri TaxID=49897 RepID=UPI0021F262B8|nr:hypothetical protein [Mycolicibacterium hodleri]MCV7134410.1 hypothetical protein [Mycolicibacterium hodleri]
MTVPAEAPDGASEPVTRAELALGPRLWSGWRAREWIVAAIGAASISSLVASFVVEPWDVGSLAEWISGLGTLAAVAVALWQSVVIRRQAAEDAVEVAARFQRELDEANRRTNEQVAAVKEMSRLELEAAEARHRSQIEAQREIARVQLDAQVDLARIQRVHLREQEFKLSLVRVSKAAGAYTHELATLVEEGRLAAKLATKPERDAALLPGAKKLGGLVQDFSVELAGAHMLTRNDELHEALNDVNAAMMRGPFAEMAFRNKVQDDGQMPNPASIYMAIDAMQTALGNVRQAAGDLLDTGWE